MRVLQAVLWMYQTGFGTIYDFGSRIWKAKLHLRMKSILLQAIKSRKYPRNTVSEEVGVLLISIHCPVTKTLMYWQRSATSGAGQNSRAELMYLNADNGQPVKS
jgi:hypothetical protein